MIKRDHIALGVGAGREALIFWFGDHVKEVVATDLYGNETWSTQGGREADPGILRNSQQYCPRRLTRNNITFLNMDGRKLQFDTGSFDIVWSMSSIEHFGGHDQAARAVREIARVLRPNGVVALATEYLLLDTYTHPEYFNRADVFKYLVHASPNLELIEPIDFSLPPQEYLIDSIVFPNGSTRLRRHVVLNDGDVQWTSIMLFFRKV